MSSRIIIAVLSTAVVFLPAAIACAQGVAFAVIDGPYADAELNRLHLFTGILVPVGPIGHKSTHIAFDSVGTLYGVGINPGQLIEIDIQRGLGSEVGPLGTSITDVRGLSFCDGDRLWMTAVDGAYGPGLYEVNPSTGTATRFVDIPYEHFGSLACDGDTLLMTGNSLASVDTSTGAVTMFPSSDFGIWSARAASRDDNETLWSLMLCGPCAGPSDVLTIRTIDLLTGTVDDEGPSEPHGTWGLAILPGGIHVDGFESGGADMWSTASAHFASSPKHRR